MPSPAIPHQTRVHVAWNGYCSIPAHALPSKRARIAYDTSGALNVQERGQPMARHKADVADDDFEIFASYHGTGDGRYVGGLKVVRKADRKLLFPFDGAPEIGPYATADEARRAAINYGREIVAADRAAPEK
jgi:hypothetical protein